MSLRHDTGGYDRLKDELRRLKRAGAPWYFESELHRRLHGERTRRVRRAPYPAIPAMVIALVAIGSIAVATYVMMVHSNLFAPRPVDRGGMETGGAPGDTAVHLVPPAAPTLGAQAPRPSPARPGAGELTPPRRTAAERTEADSLLWITRTVADTVLPAVSLPATDAAPPQDSLLKVKNAIARPESLREVTRKPPGETPKDSTSVRKDTLQAGGRGPGK